jgi:biopolymer transport protein ExbD
MQQVATSVKKQTLLSTRLRERKAPTLSMAPMIDCVFLLLIFFMVSTTFSPMPGIRVQLPPPGKPSPNKPKGLIVRIANPAGGQRQGIMVLDDEIIEIEQVFDRFINASEDRKNMLIIQSERKVMHEQIIQIMDRAKAAGIDKVGFAVVARE